MDAAMRDLDQELIVSLAAAWHDTHPLLDYAAKLDLSHVELSRKLSWYAHHVMPAVKNIPITIEAVTWIFWPMQEEAYKKLRQHPQCQLLSQVAAIAFCRIPEL